MHCSKIGESFYFYSATISKIESGKANWFSVILKVSLFFEENLQGVHHMVSRIDEPTNWQQKFSYFVNSLFYFMNLRLITFEEVDKKLDSSEL